MLQHPLWTRAQQYIRAAERIGLKFQPEMATFKLPPPLCQPHISAFRVWAKFASAQVCDTTGTTALATIMLWQSGLPTKSFRVDAAGACGIPQHRQIAAAGASGRSSSCNLGKLSAERRKLPSRKSFQSGRPKVSCAASESANPVRPSLRFA